VHTRACKRGCVGTFGGYPPTPSTTPTHHPHTDTPPRTLPLRLQLRDVALRVRGGWRSLGLRCVAGGARRKAGPRLTPRGFHTGAHSRSQERGLRGTKWQGAHRAPGANEGWVHGDHRANPHAATQSGGVCAGCVWHGCNRVDLGEAYGVVVVVGGGVIGGGSANVCVRVLGGNVACEQAPQGSRRYLSGHCRHGRDDGAEHPYTASCKQDLAQPGGDGEGRQLLSNGSQALLHDRHGAAVATPCARASTTATVPACDSQSTHRHNRQWSYKRGKAPGGVVVACAHTAAAGAGGMRLLQQQSPRRRQWPPGDSVDGGGGG
jgi:hypothetical protein